MGKRKTLRVASTLICASVILTFFASSCAAPKPAYRVAVIGFKNGQLNAERSSLAEYGKRRVEAELGAKVDFITPETGSKPEDLFLSGAEGYDLVVSLGQGSSQDMLSFRPGGTQVQAAALDFTSPQPVPGEDAATLVRYRVEEGAYVCGYLAGWLTSRNDHPLTNAAPNVAFIGAMDDLLEPYYDSGYSKGVRAAVPEPGIYRYFLATGEDSANARACAEQGIKKGVDIIFCTPGPFNSEVIKVAVEKKVLVILVGADRSNESPEHVLTSLILRDDNTLFDAINRAMNGELKAGRREWGIKEGAWSLAPFHGQDIYIRKELKEALQREAEGVSGIDFSTP